MSGHLAAEVLSAYLDKELVGHESELAEDHLSDCPDCRQRLDRLRRVVSRLHRVDAAVVPPYLAARIPALISGEARPKSLVDRFEARLQRLYFPLSWTSLAFGLVMILVLTVYYFVWAVDRHEASVGSTLPSEGTVRPSAPDSDGEGGDVRDR